VRLSLGAIRQRYLTRGRPLPAELEAALRADVRPGARAVLAAIEGRRHRNRAEGQRLRNILRYETTLWSEGVIHVAGVDEAGMSPLAGPVAAAAVIFPPGARIRGVDDSKKLDPAERDRLAPIIKEQCVAWAVAFVEHDEIDRINIYWAGLLAMQRAVEALSPGPQHLLIDGRRLKDIPLPQQKIIGGDAKSLSIAAASILAKTARDARMCELDQRFPGYGFAQHKGYPVQEHLRALRTIGACEVHRRSFAPVREALGLPPLADPG
jgi:ribonuclease HII